MPTYSDSRGSDPPGHVIWGDVESPRLSAGCSDSSRQKGDSGAESSRTGSGDSGNERRKIKNKRLSRSDIIFRSPASGQSSNRSGSEDVSGAGGPFGKVKGKWADEEPGPSNAPAQDDDQAESDNAGEGEGAGGQMKAQRVIVNNLSPEEVAKVTAEVRKNEDGKPTSVGSVGHPETCKPCLFVFIVVGCQNSVFCTFCHFRHKRNNRPRPCKGKRNRFRQLVQRMEDQGTASSAQRADEAAEGPSAEPEVPPAEATTADL